MDLENWNLKWRISRWTPNSILPNPVSLLFLFFFFFAGVVNCLVVFPSHFNPNNSLLKLLHISLLFMFTAVLIRWFYVELQPDWNYCLGEDRESDDCNFLNNVLCCHMQWNSACLHRVIVEYIKRKRHTVKRTEKTHGKKKNLTAKRINLTAKRKSSRQKE